MQVRARHVAFLGAKIFIRGASGLLMKWKQNGVDGGDCTQTRDKH